jgi:citrate lyase subunit beta/citryl-CoA lyase
VSDPFNVIAPLFVPGDRPERFAKAAASAADAVIIDLEDAVAPARKQAARQALVTDFTDKPVFVRINGPDTPWHEEDVRALEQLSIAGIIFPKAENITELSRLAGAHGIIALIETVAGLAEARAIARSGQVRRLAFGSVDFAADLGCDHDREALAAARAEILLASRLASLPAPLDGVTTRLDDLSVSRDDARYARRLGFGGKLCIHPAQVPVVLDGFRPSEEEVAWARQVLETDAGATSVDGAMVDEPVRVRARSILSRTE